MRDERLGCCTASNGVHHRSFNFNEAITVKIAANIGDDFGACNHDFARFVVDNEVEVALAESSLHICEGRNLVTCLVNLLGWDHV